MIPDEYSPALERAIEHADRRATEEGKSHASPVLMLVCLLEEDEGRAASLVVAHRGNLERFRFDLFQTRDTTELDRSKVFDTAKSFARKAQENTITSEFFLLAMLQAEPITRLANYAGLNIQSLTTAILGPTEIPLEVAEPIRLLDPTDQIDAGRILDANANRVRESLRILEDYCRFALDDALLSREVKTLRHDFVAVIERFPAKLLVASRDTPTDVGTRIATAREMQRGTPEQTAMVNAKRLQEAMRSLEEFGKSLDQGIAHDLEQLRYRSYTLERAIAIGQSARIQLAQVHLYVLLTGSQCEAALDWTIREAAAGGARMFQLREKTLSDRELIARAKEVRRWTREVGALFIVNDRPDIARLVQADGVHLGQDDLSVKDARRILGPDGIIGVSTHDLAQLRQAVLDGVNYVGIGPTFVSQTKRFEHLPGLDFLRSAVAETSLPAFAIGGVNLETIGRVVEAGGRRIAVSAAIAKAEEPRLAALTLSQAVQETQG